MIYKVITERRSPMNETRLNKLAEEGWRLHTILTHDVQTAVFYYYYFEMAPERLIKIQ